MKILETSKHSTIDKIADFQQLEEGWHFGEGSAPIDKTVHKANMLVSMATMSLFETDAFPGIDGEIMVTVYHGEHYLEFTIEVDESITYVCKVGNDPELFEEGLTFDEAKMKLKDFSEKIWNLPESSTLHIGTKEQEASKVWHSKTHPPVEFQSFLSSALMHPEITCASIYANFTRESHPSLRCIGYSQPKFYRQDVVLNNIIATQGMSATEIYAD